ncbi:MAG TPA: FAD-dependent oxidoreductase [Bacteroidia bacterium]|nr:FAD-dependent oxidoreductase [Bacteroidia bacterium]HNU32763.1 FAD-dependent oxidoreductase [Bacteroidia bacterium]
MTGDNHYDFIICGQGIAGTLLAWNLLESGKRVLIIDEENVTSSSRVAAGIVIPVTGRRIVKTWMAEECLKEALLTYSALEKLTGESFYKELPVLELLNSVKQKNDWQERITDENISAYVNDIVGRDEIPTGIEAKSGGVELKSCYWLDTKKFLVALRKYFIAENILVSERFDINDAVVTQYLITCKNYTASKIIFCTGYKKISDWFEGVPFQFSKGEILTIKCEGLTEEYIINNGIFMLPIGNHHFKVGSTYEWKNLDCAPTISGKEKLIADLKTFLNFSFEVTNHEASVRPTIKERRPVIGLHPIAKNIGIMNGLGTKGVLLAPWLSKHFSQHLVAGNSLNEEVDVNRFLFPGKI